MDTPEAPDEGVGLRQRRGKFATQASNAGGLRMTDDEVEAMIDQFATTDDNTAKTATRLVVEGYLSKFNWYFPKRNGRDPPSLSKAYAYYEHVTLPRHLSGTQTADHIQRRAEPGETEPTELYRPLTTPSSSLIEWGIGVDQYFSTLRLVSAIMLCAGLILLPNAIYYSSDSYRENDGGVGILLEGSAVCNDTAWVVCDDCEEGDWDRGEEAGRFATDANGTVLVLRNLCDTDGYPEGLASFFALLFIMVATMFVSYYLRAREVRFDEDKLTPSDYSVIVKNPPKDAFDPDEWRDFFSQFASKQVTCVTIAVNNEKLLDKLIARRIHRNNLRLMLPKRTDMDDEDLVRSEVAKLVRERESEPKGCLGKLLDCAVFPLLHLIGMMLPAETLVDKVFQLTEEIKELHKERYDVIKVFVTFETEAGQRNALAALSTSRLNRMLNMQQGLPEGATFRNTVLRVEEPMEPSAVRWLDLSSGVVRRYFWRIVNFALTMGIVSICGRFVRIVRNNHGAWWAAQLLLIFNSTIPVIVKILMIMEPHSSEGSYQASLYLKITLFRWINTAFVPKITTPFTLTLSPEKTNVLPQIKALLVSELWLSPTLKLLDLFGNVKKHILAPRSNTQELMNSNFQGTPYNLGERYTDLTKVMFMCFFYSALYPVAPFFCDEILLIQYYSDKYCLMRIWGWSPFIGNELASISRRYFFSGAILAYALVSAYAWAQFPYDQICDSHSTATGVAGAYEVDFLSPNKDPATVVVDQDEAVVFCAQYWRDWDTRFWPYDENAGWRQSADGTLDDEQDLLVLFYSILAYVMVILFILYFFGRAIVNSLLSWFRPVYSAHGQEQHIDFSANEEIFAYVPQIRKPGFPFPFLACSVDHIHHGLIGWHDSAHSYDHYNLVFDVPWEGMPRDRDVGSTSKKKMFSQTSTRFGTAVGSNRKQSCFSTITHYPPAWLEKIIEDDTEND